MTIPLPGGKADELLWHLATCPKCRLAKTDRNLKYCRRGMQLIAHTTEERHGPRDER